MEAIIARVIGSSSDSAAASAELKKVEPWPISLAEVNCASKRPTAADTIDEIIARQVGVGGDVAAAGWKKVGSRTSVCSDNTSDTLSADEGQRDDDEIRPRRPRVEETSASSVAGVVLPSLVDHAHNGSIPVALPTTSATGPDMGIISSFLGAGGHTFPMPQTKEPLLSSFNRHSDPLKPPDLRQKRSNGENQPVVPPGSLMASVLSRGAHTLRVRDVIHSAIEENLQSRSSPSTSLDSLWQLYSQGCGLLPAVCSAVTADTESAQDLSCRSRETHSTIPRAPPVGLPQKYVGGGPVGLLSSEKSPPPAHSHYGRPPVTVMPPLPPAPVIDRCQDPLYHLAEVAVQRGRVEVAGDRHQPSPTPAVVAGYTGQPVLRPSVHATELDHGVSAQPPGGSITLGTPRHLMAADILSRPHVPLADVSQRNLPQQAAKVKDSVELAQEALRYLGQPDSSQRAVMERVMAQAVAGGPFMPSNSSHTILMGDYVTAQQMQTSQYQQSTHPPNIQPSHRYPHRPPMDHRSGLHDHVPSPRVPDVLDGTRMPDMKHMPIAQNRPQLPERPQHASTPSSPFIRRPLTAANVIDAIITHQINKEVPGSSGTPSSGTVLSRLPEPQVTSPNSQRAVNVNGLVQPDSSISAADTCKAAYAPRHSIADRLEKERSTAANCQPAVAVRSQEMPPKTTASSVSMAQLVTRAVTLGEHIDKMIQKDFNLPAYESSAQTALDVLRNGTLLSVC